MADLQNPAVQGGASRDLLSGASHAFPTSLNWQAQWLVTHFSLSPLMAQQVSSLHFGEADHD